MQNEILQNKQLLSKAKSSDQGRTSSIYAIKIARAGLTLCRYSSDVTVLTASKLICTYPTWLDAFILKEVNRLRGLWSRISITFKRKQWRTPRFPECKDLPMGGSPGLVVMWGDSCSKGREFESQQCILDWHFSHLFVVRIVMFVW